jgi:GntR family transcriptional regulator, arabinose operon transcriptional repressor
MRPVQNQKTVVKKKAAKSALDERAPINPTGSSHSGLELPMHRQIYQVLLREIQNGTYQPGDRLPSETLLCKRFDASRITVAKAIQQLQSERLVSRISGSGTYVEQPERTEAFQFGLLIPELGSTEIFEPICRGMMNSPLAKSHSLIWGHSLADETDRSKAAMQLCQQYISQKVAGVFFAPIEYATESDHTNSDIVAAFERANIPIVLLDRCFKSYPDRAPYDLIGIDNHRAGYTMTRHLLHVGASRIIFLARPNSASTVNARIAGYREALDAHGKQPPYGTGTYFGDFSDISLMSRILADTSPDAIVCANDVTAATVMQSLLKLGVSIPEQVRIVGMDDVSYAKFLPIPLTTLHQNCGEMGAVALSTMLDRLRSPSTSARDILLPCEVVIRESCGAQLGSRQSASAKGQK